MSAIPVSPTGFELDEALRARLAALSPEKRALVEAQLRAARRAPVEQGIRRRSTAGDAPLSFAQELLWWFEQTTPGTATYNVPRAVRVRGSLDVSRLQAALDAIVARHEVLRTTFAEVDGEPVQRVGDPATVPVARFDLRDRDERTRAIAVDALLREQAVAPFDLTADLLLRAVLVTVTDDDHVLLLVTHHIASDGSSRDILFRELSEFYESTPRTEALPLQYGDFAAWQRSQLSGATLDRLLAFWRTQLADATGEIDLPLDRPRGSLPSFEGARHVETLPGALAERVVVFAREHGATPFMVLLAAFQALLHRHGGQNDIVVGSVLTGRGAPELEGLIGYFSNALPLRTRFDGDPGFAALLERVRATCLDATEHAGLPYEKLALELRGGTTAARAPLFRVMFAMLDDGRVVPQLGDAHVAPLTIDRGIAKFDLTLGVGLADDGLRVVFEYRTDLFDAATIGRMASHFATLLTAALDSPATRVSALPLLPPRERAQLLTEWNATAAPWATDASLVSLVAAQAQRTPEAIAVVHDGDRVSYRELLDRAHGVAQRLSQCGVRRGSLVGVCVDRTPELIVALIGVQLAGAAYVPLDPDYPAERVAFMLRDTAAGVLVTHGDVVARLPWLAALAKSDDAPAHILRLDDQATADSGDPGVLDSPRPDDVAYVIYTSGSTGVPKGVLIEHRNAAALVSWAQGVFDRSELAGVLASTSVCFDLSIFEIFVTLASGGTVILAPNALALPDVARTSPVPITLVNTVPSAIAELVRAGAIPASVRTVNLAGELLSQTVVDALYTLPHVQRVYDLYGPSEDTTYSTFVLRTRGGRPSIGRPIANTRAYVLDAHQQLVPIGVPGELYLAGAGVARGYLDRPELTADRFVTIDPAHGVVERAYRTGDRVRYLASGDLEYLGRLDHQVKLRGFRIELGEVEAAVMTVRGVARAVAIVREVAAGESRLLCYHVDDATTGVDLDEKALRDAVARVLPHYMVPSAFVRLDAFPLTQNGKLDRAALPLPVERASAPDAPSATFVAPADGTEAAIAAMWRDVLGIARVGARDDFFDLGGHSLLAMRVLGRIAAAYGVRVSLRSFIEAPTVEALAAHVGASVPAAGLVPASIPRRGNRVAPLSPAQEVLWLVQQASPALAAYNVRDARRLTGELDVAGLERALGALVARHEALRSAFGIEGGRPVQFPVEGAPVPLERLDMCHGGAQSLDDALREFGARAFHLGRGQLLRALLVRTGATEHVLLLVSHHIVCDGWSLGVMFRELDALYAREVGAPARPLAEPPLAFGDWTAWRESVQTEDESSLAYWRDALAGVPESLDLPTDRVRGATAGHAGGHAVLNVPIDRIEQLRAFARARDTTPFVTLLAVFDVLLARCSRQDDVVVGVPVAGRDHPATENVVGYFANTVPVRARIDDDPTFGAFVTRVRDAYVGAYDHATIPPERLATELLGGATGFISAMFILQDGAARGDTLGPLSAEPMGFETGTAKFDLTLSATEHVDGLRLSLEYRAALFDPETAAAMLRHFDVLVQSALEAPDTPVHTLPMATAGEMASAMAARAASERDYPRSCTVAALIAEQAARTPDAVAIEDDAARLTYAALIERSDAFAARLRALGAREESLVALCMDRSTEMLVALLGVLRAGAAYVPLDPGFPTARLSLVLDDCRAPIIVTEPSLRALVDGVVRGVSKDGEYAPAVTYVDGEPDRLAPSQASGDSPAYVLYTSGSTGRPKGVVVPHRALVNLLWAMTRRAGDAPAAGEPDHVRPQLIGPNDTVLAVTTIAFDIAGLELWAPLVVGGRVVLASRTTVVDGAALAERLASSRATVLQATPATWRLLLAAGWRPTRSLRMLVGGEALPPLLATELLDGSDATDVDGGGLWNLYGPTETTIWSATARITPTIARAAAAGTRGIPLGSALANEQLFVVEPSGMLAADGIPGELVIAGDGVASGYLNRPELTAERFGEIAQLPGLGRAYRSGDLVRRRPGDGALEFLGRLDTQVKLRGFRVELAEIERTLVAHPAVGQAVVSLYGGADAVAPHEPMLVAYWVAVDGMHADADALRMLCRARLPEYMVPVHIMELTALPLTPNGKIDRKALPAPLAPLVGSRRSVAPETPIEEEIAAAWRETLGIAEVGATDDFFGLGGHSLLAMRLVAGLRASFGLDFTINDVFAARTIRDMGRLIEARLSALLATDADLARALADLPGVESSVLADGPMNRVLSASEGAP